MRGDRGGKAIWIVLLTGLATSVAWSQANAQYSNCQQPGGQQLPGCGSAQDTYNGEVFRGAARGAARGALIGSISGNAGRGAAIGAATGGVFSAGRRAALRR